MKISLPTAAADATGAAGIAAAFTVVEVGSPNVIVLAPPGAVRTLVEGLLIFMSPLISVLILNKGVCGKTSAIGRICLYFGDHRVAQGLFATIESMTSKLSICQRKKRGGMSKKITAPINSKNTKN